MEEFRFTIGEYAKHKGIYRQLAQLHVMQELKKGSIKPAEPKLVRGKPTLAYRFTDGSTFVLEASMRVPVEIDARFFSDPFNRTGWSTWNY